ncbi:MAG: chloride channel protein [Verrucomicrobiia bacterium]
MRGLISYFQKIPQRWRGILGVCLFGLVASLGAVGFQLVINWIYQFGFIRASHSPHFLWISLGVISVGSLISGWLLSSFCPEAAGSGIPQLKLAFWKEFGHTPRRIAWVKFVAGALSIGGGQSLGREGPSVQIGGSLASTVAGWFGFAKQNKRAAAAAGAAAGLAAAFNAPLAGVAFVLEEILEDLNSRFLGAVLVAAVIGAFVVHAFVGPQPAFELPRIGEPTWRAYLLIPVVAAIAALVGVFFQRWCLQLRMATKKLHVIPRMLHPFIGGVITWGIGIAVFYTTGRLGVFSLGYEDLSAALNHRVVWQIAAILCVAKLASTIICYGLGGCGGIFSPNLFFGGMCGVVIAGLSSYFFDLTDSGKLLLIVGGMSACLGAVVQAPVTAILIIFEMTHQFALIPGLMLAGLVSQAVARSLNHTNFYEEVLLQDGHAMEHIIPPRDLQSWQNLPASAIANFDPVTVERLEEKELKELLGRAPYRYFPVVENGKLKGILARTEIDAAREENRPAQLLPASTIRPKQTIRECQNALIESVAGIVVLTDKPEGMPLAVLTLHDVLRTQIAMSEREG